MPSFTSFLDLYKPGGGSSGLIVPDEVADVDRLNANFDQLDANALSQFNRSKKFPLNVADNAERDAWYPTPAKGDRVWNRTFESEQYYDGTAWRTFFGVKAFTYSRGNVDDTAQYPQLVDDAPNTTDSTIATFQRVSGSDPDGPGGVKIAAPGTYHIFFSFTAPIGMTGRSFIQIAADADPIHRHRASIFAGEDYMSVNQIVRTTVVDHVVLLFFYKKNGNLTANNGRVTVRRLG